MVEAQRTFVASADDLISKLPYLDADSLRNLLEQIQSALAKRSEVPLPDKEQQLLSAIRNIIPASVLRRYKQLKKKQLQGNIHNTEADELQMIVDLIEEKSAERVYLLNNLAMLRNISLTELIQQIRLQDFYA